MGWKGGGGGREDYQIWDVILLTVRFTDLKSKSCWQTEQRIDNQVSEVKGLKCQGC